MTSASIQDADPARRSQLQIALRRSLLAQRDATCTRKCGNQLYQLGDLHGALWAYSIAIHLHVDSMALQTHNVPPTNAAAGLDTRFHCLPSVVSLLEQLQGAQFNAATFDYNGTILCAPAMAASRVSQPAMRPTGQSRNARRKAKRNSGRCDDKDADTLAVKWWRSLPYARLPCTIDVDAHHDTQRSELAKVLSNRCAACLEEY